MPAAAEPGPAGRASGTGLGSATFALLQNPSSAIALPPPVLQVAHAKLDSLETNVAELLSREGNLHQKIGALELERDSLLKMVAQLQAEHRGHTPANGDPLDA